MEYPTPLPHVPPPPPAARVGDDKGAGARERAWRQRAGAAGHSHRLGTAQHGQMEQPARPGPPLASHCVSVCVSVRVCLSKKGE